MTSKAPESSNVVHLHVARAGKVRTQNAKPPLPAAPTKENSSWPVVKLDANDRYLMAIGRMMHEGNEQKDVVTVLTAPMKQGVVGRTDGELVLCKFKWMQLKQKVDRAFADLKECRDIEPDPPLGCA